MADFKFYLKDKIIQLKEIFKKIKEGCRNNPELLEKLNKNFKRGIT